MLIGPVEKLSIIHLYKYFFLHFALKILEIAHAIPAFFALTVEKNIYKSK